MLLNPSSSWYVNLCIYVKAHHHHTHRQSCQQCTSYMYTSPHHESACIAFLYVPLVPLFFSSSLGLAYEAILPKHGCHIKQLLIKAKVLNILTFFYCLLVKRSSMRLLSKFELKIPPSYPRLTF